MREIFVRRGKRVDNGEWVYGNIVFTRSGRAFLLEGSFFSGENHEGDFKHGEIYGTEVIPETVGQYTEMSDNNHDGIFEGDIVRCKQEKNEGICVVRWFNGAFVACPISGNLLEMTLHDYWYNDYDLIEVIGNETDNPELLKGE